jgi:hypothetical protein
MYKLLAVVFICATGSLAALQNSPWLGNWLEFEGSLFQSHTQARRVQTHDGTKHFFTHSELTTASIEFMPLVELSTELELDLAKTQSRSYGFEAIKAGARYLWLNDLTGDPVSLTTGLSTALSTPSRVKDLSSQQHGVFEVQLNVALGREFAYSADGYYHAWLQGLAGLASSGAPWVGAELHFEKALFNRHYLDLFFIAERSLSSHRLNTLRNFHSYSRIGYEYEDLGLSYTFRQEAFGSFYVECTKRLHARYCPKGAISFQLGLIIPFSPW